MCMELPINAFKMPKIQFIYGVSMYFIVLGIGVYFDYQMFLFVKNRNKIEPTQTQIVPWKSSNNKGIHLLLSQSKTVSQMIVRNINYYNFIEIM